MQYYALFCNFIQYIYIESNWSHATTHYIAIQPVTLQYNTMQQFAVQYIYIKSNWPHDGDGQTASYGGGGLQSWQLGQIGLEKKQSHLQQIKPYNFSKSKNDYLDK